MADQYGSDYITIVDEDGTEYELEVIDACLQSAPIKKTNWMHYDSICRMHGVEPFSLGFYKAFENYLAAYTRSGFNMLLTPLFTPPLDTEIGHVRTTAQLVGVAVEKEGYSFDFTNLKYFLDFVLSRGIELEKIEKERPNPEKTEIAALAYKYGYEAGLKAQSEK